MELAPVVTLQLRCHPASHFGTAKYFRKRHFQNYRCNFERELCLLGCFCVIPYCQLPVIIEDTLERKNVATEWMQQSKIRKLVNFAPLKHG